MDFKTWAVDKKLKDSDLLFKKALKTPSQEDLFLKAADHMATLKPSFTEGLQTLELLTDLILMGHDEALFGGAGVPVTSDNFQPLIFESWKESLRRLRYPETSLRDDDLKIKLEKLPWPYGSKVKFERRGDRAGVELKLFVSSSTDLTKILASLERVQEEISK
ncbi:MAG: hypothetical protein H7328_05505 [Bdellovibrio sp.]|nr:hypothetical protein [Bdellovibrio sp.]